ncbi:MAG: hypothetical protein JWM11_3374 [Planctomycetaceae bacterium]|nr:hypothetical protein [Planctomycetaceae bacterium]
MQRPLFWPQKSIRETRPSNVRPGFTMVELLIVVAIIALLMSILGVAVMSMIGTAKVSATRATIVKVQGLLQSRIDAVTRNKIDRPYVTSFAASNFNGNLARAEAVLNKMRFRASFPQTWSEVPVTLITSLPPGSPMIPTSPAGPQESAEVLYFLLTKANILGYPPEGEDVFSTSEVKDTNNNGWPEIIDAWGQPLRFYRWPTRMIRGTVLTGVFPPTATARLLIPGLPSTTSELTHDAEDKYRTLQIGVNPPPPPKPRDYYGINPSDITNFELGQGPWSKMAGANLWGAAQMNITNWPFHTPETYSLPLIVSAGADGQTGLFEPNDLTNFGHLAALDPSTNLNVTYDDISNYTNRSGGK